MPKEIDNKDNNIIEYLYSLRFYYKLKFKHFKHYLKPFINRL
jgi:hypothetical protein